MADDRQDILYNEEALRPIRLLESRNQESGIVLKTFLIHASHLRKHVSFH